MMRELKFRAWHRAEKCWHYFELIGVKAYPELESSESRQYQNRCVWTGLLDRNGVEIYEGDILRGKYGEQGSEPQDLDYKGFVESILGSYRAFGHCLSKLRSIPSDQRCEILWRVRNELRRQSWYYQIIDIEVIGSIHEHPELIKEDSDA